MIQLGELQSLIISRTTINGVYLSEDNSANGGVLLPKNQVTSDMSIGDTIDVFIYRDSEDRLIATTAKPFLTIGKVKMLRVTDVTSIGAFLDWGLSKDLLLPFKEQKEPVKVGDHVLVTLYIDKSDRLCATTKIYDYLSTESHYSKGDEVDGTVFDINPKLGAFVAVDNTYLALIPASEGISNLHYMDNIHARIVAIRDDGKINLSLRKQIVDQMSNDSVLIMDKLSDSNGFLPFNDKSSPEDIKRTFGMTKNSFKRAIGRLYKEKKIDIKNDGIYLN